MLAISALSGAYLVGTFTSTGLAKLRRRKAATIGLISEAVIPEKFAHITVLCLSTLELTITTLVVMGIDAFMVGLLTAVIFFIFGIYRSLSAVKTGRISCSCAGTARRSNASISKISGMLFASLVQAAIACIWAFDPISPNGKAEVFLTFVAIIPVALFCIGFIPERRKSAGDAAGSATT
ncbi:hypothetical protein GCM10029978_039060 [Actinoallomurus acanthiterrae]